MNTVVAEEMLIAGSPNHVWSLISESEHFQAWYAFGGATINLRPGGIITMHWDEHGSFEALVETVVPEKLLEFRWTFEPKSLVKISLESGDPNTTIVRIEESGALENPEQSALAWRNGLSLLARLATIQTDLSNM